MSQKTPEHYGPTVGEKDGIRLIDCQVCGFIHIDPMPSPEDLRTLYEESFYQSDKDNYIVENEEDIQWKRLEMQDRIDTVNTLLPPDMPRTAFDVGTGPGTFLEVARDTGWQASGIEPSPVASNYCRDRGLDVATGFFNAETTKPDNALSFLHLSEVLEHIADPFDLLRIAWDWLLPGGVLCVSVPNDYNPLQKAASAGLGIPNWWEAPDHHINYFTHASLEGLLQRAGFELCGRSTNFPMELFLLMGDNYIGDSALGRQLHGKRKQVELTLAHYAPEARAALYSALASVGLGRLAIVYAQKPINGPKTP